MDVFDVYFEEFENNTKEIHKELQAKDSREKFKTLGDLLKENQQCIDLIEAELLNVSFARQSKIENKLIRLKKEYTNQRKDIRKKRERFAYMTDKDELFENMEDPLLKNKDNGQNQIDAMNNKLLDANLLGYEAEMYGNNARNELFRNRDQYGAIERNVRKKTKKSISFSLPKIEEMLRHKS